MSTRVEVAGVGIIRSVGSNDRSVIDWRAPVPSALCATPTSQPRRRRRPGLVLRHGLSGVRPPGNRVLGALALTGGIVDTSKPVRLRCGALSLSAGSIPIRRATLLLVLGSGKNAEGDESAVVLRPRGSSQAGWPHAACHAYFAPARQRLPPRVGLPKSHLRAVVVKNRANGVNNPDEIFPEEPVTAEDVLAPGSLCPCTFVMLSRRTKGPLQWCFGAAFLEGRAVASSCGRVPARAPSCIVLAESTPLCCITTPAIPPPPSCSSATRPYGRTPFSGP